MMKKQLNLGFQIPLPYCFIKTTWFAVMRVGAMSPMLPTVFQNFLLKYLGWNFIAAIVISLRASIKRASNATVLNM